MERGLKWKQPIKSVMENVRSAPGIIQMEDVRNGRNDKIEAV